MKVHTHIIAMIALILSFIGTTRSISAAPTTYYVDCAAGDDKKNGTAPEQAWSSLAKANEAPLAPGDQLLLKRGCTWPAGLRLSQSGTASQPIYIGAYGSGEYPIIQSNRSEVDAVAISGNYITIENLYAKGIAPIKDPKCDNTPVGLINGFAFKSGVSYNTLKNSKASGLSSGILIDEKAHNNKIIGNVLTDNNMMSSLTPKSANDDDDAGAFGIEVLGDDNEIAYNTISGGNACSYDYERDGSAIEIYGGRRNIVHHNVGLENDTFTELGDSRSADNIFAYNIVKSTLKQATFLVTRGPKDDYGPVARTKAYNNTVYLTGSESSTVECYAGCSKDILTLKNNILWSENVIGYSDQPFDEGYNLVWRSNGKPVVHFSLSGKQEGLNPTSKQADPQFVDLAAGDFRLQASSPAINAGMSDAVIAGFTADINGQAVQAGATVDIGAYKAGAPAPNTSTTTAPSTPTKTNSSTLPIITRRDLNVG